MNPEELFIYLVSSVIILLYFISNSVFYYGLIRSSRTTGKNTHFTPDGFHIISVVIAVRNEEENILKLLNCLKEQKYPEKQWEVLISDDYSTDNTVLQLFNFKKSHPDFPLRIILPGYLVNSSGKKAALTRAISTANGKIIICTDGDVSFGSDWLTSMVAPFTNPNIQMVLGPVIINPGKNLLEKIVEMENFGIMGITAGSARIGKPVTANGANIGFRTEAFFQVGGYQPNNGYSSGDDQFLLMDIRKFFGKEAITFIFHQSASVFTDAESRLKSFFSQRIRWFSKSKEYKDLFILVIGMIISSTIFIVDGLLVVSLFSFSLKWLLISISFLIIKFAADFPLVSFMRRFSKNQSSRLFFIPAQLFQLVYFPLVIISSWFIQIRWKGRRI